MKKVLPKFEQSSRKHFQKLFPKSIKARKLSIEKTIHKTHTKKLVCENLEKQLNGKTVDKKKILGRKSRKRKQI
jgi:hypothetical protein